VQEMPAAQALPFIADLASAAVAGLTWLIVPGLNLLHFARAQRAEVAKNGPIVWVAWRIGQADVAEQIGPACNQVEHDRAVWQHRCCSNALRLFHFGNLYDLSSGRIVSALITRLGPFCGRKQRAQCNAQRRHAILPHGWSSQYFFRFGVSASLPSAWRAALSA